MKNLTKVILVLLACVFTAFVSKTKKPTKIKVTPLKVKSVPMIVPVSIEPDLTTTVPFVKHSHEDFLDAIGYQESRNRYDIVNRFGYMGKYQFGQRTLRHLKIKVTKKEFLNSPELQEEAMIKLLQANQRSLKKYIEKYADTWHDGMFITESGILAAAHLGGAGSVKKYFKRGVVRSDGNGMKITTYMEKFSNYELDI